MTPVLAFDIETVPDTAGLRRIHGLAPEMSDAEVAEFAFQRRREAIGSDFLQLHLHRVVAISCALRERNSFRVWSLGDAGDAEGELLQRFFDLGHSLVHALQFDTHPAVGACTGKYEADNGQHMTIVDRWVEFWLGLLRRVAAVIHGFVLVAVLAMQTGSLIIA